MFQINNDVPAATNVFKSSPMTRKRFKMYQVFFFFYFASFLFYCPNHNGKNTIKSLNAKFLLKL